MSFVDVQVIPKPTLDGKLTIGDQVELVFSPPEGMEAATLVEPKEEEAAAAENSATVPSPEAKTDAKTDTKPKKKIQVINQKPYNDKTKKMSLTVTAYEAGKYEIPSYTFQSGDQSFATTPQNVEFAGVKKAEEEQQALYPPVKAPFPMGAFFGFLGILLLLTALIVFLIRKFSKKEDVAQVVAPKAPPLSAWEEFSQSYAKTLSMGYLEKSEFKPHYFGMSEATKRFLGKLHHFDAEESTTRELVQKLSAHGISSDVLDQWKKIFTNLDIVKFTDFKPTSTQAKELSQSIYSLCEKAWAQFGVKKNEL